MQFLSNLIIWNPRKPQLKNIDFQLIGIRNYSSWIFNVCYETFRLHEVTKSEFSFYLIFSRICRNLLIMYKKCGQWMFYGNFLKAWLYNTVCILIIKTLLEMLFLMHGSCRMWTSKILFCALTAIKWLTDLEIECNKMPVVI